MYMYVCIYVMHVCMYVCNVCACMYTCIYAHVCMHICMHACMHARMHARIMHTHDAFTYILTHTHIHTHTHTHTHTHMDCRRRYTRAQHLNRIYIKPERRRRTGGREGTGKSPSHELDLAYSWKPFRHALARARTNCPHTWTSKSLQATRILLYFQFVFGSACGQA